MNGQLAQTVRQAESQLQESQQAFDTKVHHGLLQDSCRLKPSSVDLHLESHKSRSRTLFSPSREDLTPFLAYERTS